MKAANLSKLDAELKNYHDKPFLEAALAVCAISAHADDKVTMLERCQIDAAIMREPGLREFGFDKATEVLEGYISALTDSGAAARAALEDKVRQMAGEPARARTLMRVAYLIFTANQSIDEEESEAFRRLCRLLDLPAAETLSDLEAGAV
jgi:tellurite resistance protein